MRHILGGGYPASVQLASSCSSTEALTIIPATPPSSLSTAVDLIHGHTASRAMGNADGLPADIGRCGRIGVRWHRVGGRASTVSTGTH